MTLKQWLDSYNTPSIAAGDDAVASYIPPNTELVRSLTDAYFRDQERKAEVAFTVAFLRLQADLPTIDEKGVITYKDGRTGSYALNEDIQDAILPFLQKWGFTLHFETRHPDQFRIAVDGVLTHKKGHARRTTFEAPADTSGGKNAGQARGSILSYGHRYCSVDLLNLVTRGMDNDGQSFRFGFNPEQLATPEAKATFKTLLHAALDGDLDTAWASIDVNERASVGYEGFQYVKALAGYVR